MEGARARRAGGSILSASFVLELARGHCSTTASAFGMQHILLGSGTHPPERLPWPEATALRLETERLP